MGRHYRRALWVAAAAVGALAFVGAAAACGVNLDVAFADAGTGSTDASEDTRQKVRESSVDTPDVQTFATPPSPTFPCDGGLGSDQACDNSQGKGCCLANAEANCMDESVMSSCQGVFIGCREAMADNACCWLDNGKTHVARFVADCDGGPMACISDGGCPPDLACATIMCQGGFEIGQCGSQPPTCPN